MAMESSAALRGNCCTSIATAAVSPQNSNCRANAAPLVSRPRSRALAAATRVNHHCAGIEIRGGVSLPRRRRGKASTYFFQEVFNEPAVSKVQRRELMRQSMVGGLLVCTAALAEQSVAVPTKGLESLPFKPDGYNYWTWRGHKVHYVVQGEGKPIVLIHGFGASVFHWRYNIPELAKHGYKVYAMDLLGFGWTEKALVDYSASLWKDQVADFLQEVVGGPAVLVGNSVGGFTALLTAASNPELVSGLALLNASGQFDSPPVEGQKETVLEETALQRLVITPVKDFARRWAIAFAFWQAKQPARIKSVLQNVYKDHTNVDDYLVQSILLPAKDPNAGEAYYRMMTQMMMKSSEITLNKLLEKLKCPLLLLWGDLDPWMGATKADKIKELYPSATLVRLQAGHCPHDEDPEASNQALLNWAATL